MAIGRRHFHRQRNADRLSNHAAFDAPGRGWWDWGRVFFSPSGTLVIAPSSASQLQSIPWSASYASPTARTSQTRQHLSIPGSAGMPKSMSKCRRHRAHSTASRYAAPTESHPSLPGSTPAAGDTLADAYFGAESNGSMRSHSSSLIRKPSSSLFCIVREAVVPLLGQIPHSFFTTDNLRDSSTSYDNFFHAVSRAVGLR